MPDPAPKIEFDLAPWQREFIDTVFSSPYYEWAGVSLETLRPGHARVSLQANPITHTPWGSVNGGSIASLLELPAFLALLTEMKEGEFAATIDLFVQNLKPIPAGAPVVLEGRLIRRARSLAWCESAALLSETPHTLARITKSLKT